MSRSCASLSDFDFSSDNSSSSEGDEKPKLVCKVFCENKKLNLELESAFSEIASLRSVHDDMSAKRCDNCNMIMVNCADLWLIVSAHKMLISSANISCKCKE
jgi:hypothetical protein